MKKKVYVWPICIRVFHWLYVFSFTFAFILLWFENLLKYHVAFGILFFILTIFRIVFGFLGPLYVNFKCFDLKGDHLINYILHLFGHKDKTPGHNPGASWGAITILIFAFITGFSGILLFGIQEGRGIFSFLNPTFFYYMDTLYNIHEISAYFLLFVVIIHISGVIFEHFYHHTKVIWSMFTGYKYLLDGEDIKLTSKQNFFADFFIFISVVLFFYTVYKDNNILLKSRFEPINYETKYPTLYEECGDCHIVFPAYLLPSKSWEIIMDIPEDHYGEELDLDEDDAKLIKEYLVKNSAEHSTREAAVKILKSIKNKENVKSIVKTPYWKSTHKNIPNSVFKSKKVDTKFSCDSCHPDILKGKIEDDNIIIPGVKFNESIKMHIFPKTEVKNEKNFD